MDIVDNLRGPNGNIFALAAADEIERLRKQNEELREQVKALEEAFERQERDAADAAIHREAWNPHREP
jgi:hypothetical protein